MKIIVTGGAGYIGSHTVVELVESGYTPIILDNLSNTDVRNIEGIKKLTDKEIKFYNVDCTDKDAVKSVFDKEKDILGIIHFAAFKSVEESVRLAEKYFKNNVGSLEVILDQMKKYNINNIIFSSSCTVYGSPDKLPVTENSPFKRPNHLMERQSNNVKKFCNQLQ